MSLWAAMDGVPPEEGRWDVVIVDEGQDFSGDDWELARECVRTDGKLWVFPDQGQAFWADRGLGGDSFQGFMRFNLKKPYRCHPAIQNLDDAYSGKCEPDSKLLKESMEAGVIQIITSSETRFFKQMEKEINCLLSSGLKPSDIAVLSLRGRGSEKSIIHQKEIAGHRLVPATYPNAGEESICDTFLLREPGRYKVVSPERFVKGAFECPDTLSIQTYLERRYRN